MVKSIIEEIRDNVSSKSTIDTLYSILDKDESTKEKFIRLFLSDYYKLAFYDGLVKKDFSNLEIFDLDFSNLLDQCTDNYKTLSIIINASKRFNSLNRLSKIHLFNILSLCNQDENLVQISNSHILDMCSYSFDYSIDSFKEYYINFDTGENIVPYKKASEYIAKRLLKYKNTNFNEYSKFVLEFLKEYYKWNTFVSKTQSEGSISLKNLFYLEIINSMPLDKIIDYSINNVDFLATILDEYLYYSTSDKNISGPIVDEFFSENVSPTMKNKLYSK